MRAVRMPFSRGAALALEEAAGDLAGGVHALLDVHREGEEVDVARACPRWRCTEPSCRRRVTTTEPFACLASLPVSKLISVPPISTETRSRAYSAHMLCSFRQPPVGCLRFGLFISGNFAANASSGPRPISGVQPIPERGAIRARARAPGTSDAIALDVVAAEVLQQAPALADQHQQAAPGVMVLLVAAQVLGELVDARRQQGHLHLGRAGVALVLGELAASPRTWPLW